MSSDKIWGERGFFDKCAWKRKKGRDVKGIKDVKLLTDLVRGGKLRRKRHAREKRDEKAKTEGE
jgi:hypothetical protein